MECYHGTSSQSAGINILQQIAAMKSNIAQRTELDT